MNDGFVHVLDAAARDQLRHLELVARRNVDGMLHGLHRSRRKGVSTEFDHHSLYQPGDTLRHVDWKVSARQDRYFVRRYHEDTALAVRLVIDRSASMTADPEGTAVSKHLAASRLAAAFAYLTLRQRDSVAAVLAHGAGLRWLPARSSEGQLLAILTALVVQEPPSVGDGLVAALRALRERNERRGLVAVISDLQCDPAPVQSELASLQAQGQEVVLFQPRAAAEEEFPYRRWMVFADAERAGIRHRVDGVALRRIYREEYAAHQAQWTTWASRRDAHLISFRCEEPIAGVLAAYLARRRGGG